MSPGRPIRVVYLDHVARLSGGELALLGLIRSLGDAVEAHVVLGEDGPLAPRLRDEAASVEVLPLARRLRDTRRNKVRPRAFVSLPLYIVRLARRLRELQPDLVHTNSLKSALYGGVAGRLVGVPVIWHVRDRISPDYLSPTAVHLVRLAARILPTAVVANSRATLATIPSARHGRVVYNAVVPPPSEPAPEDGGSLTVGIVGRLAPWKGQHIFLDAFAAAFERRSAQARIVGAAMFGEEEYEQALRAQVEHLGLAECVEFRGFRESVWNELAKLDVLVHCSTLPEPFGQVVLEGMAAGLPVIAAAAGGPAELITDGVDGLLVPAGDVMELAATLGRLAADPDLRRRLGSAARRRSGAFTAERAAAEMLEIYASVHRLD